MTPFDNPEAPPEAEEADPEVASIEDVAEAMSGYWAAEKDPEILFDTLSKKEEAYHDCLERRGLYHMARLAYNQYYGFGASGEFETQCIQFVGQDGELVQFRIGEFRSYCDQIFNMTTKNRPAFQAQAINPDPQTLGQINASDSIVKYYYEQVFGERKEKEVVKSEGLYGKAFTTIDWDADSGDEVPVSETIETEMGPMTKESTARSGRLVISRRFFWHVCSEAFRSESEEHLWRSVYDTRNKFDMIAKFPAFAKDIEEQESCETTFLNRFPGYDADVEHDPDSVAVRVFYHAKTPVLPNGRRVLFVGQVMVEDDDLQIDVIPVIPFMSCELDGTSFGVSDLWNLIPTAQMKDQMLSDFATSVESWARPPLVVDEGTDFDLDALANGQKVLTKAPGAAMPEVVSFPAIPDIAPSLDMLRKLEQSMSGLNAISRGEADASVKSGTHAALYHAIAVEAQAPRQANLDLHRETSANIILQFLKAFATNPQMVAIAGEDERPYLQMFTQKDIAHVYRVVIKTANPMMRTQAGRLQVAELLRDWPGMPIKNPEEIIELLVSGQWKPLYQPARVQNLKIKQENSLLAAGPPVQETREIDPVTGAPKLKRTVPTVPVLATDNAANHINGHLEVLTSPDTLSNKAKFDAVLTHIAEHVELARNGDPYLAQLLGNPPPQMAPGMDPNATSSGAEGPSDKDLERAQDVGTPPSAKPSPTSPEAQDDALGGRMPRPAQPPNMAGS